MVFGVSAGMEHLSAGVDGMAGVEHLSAGADGVLWIEGVYLTLGHLKAYLKVEEEGLLCVGVEGLPCVVHRWAVPAGDDATVISS